MSFATLLQALSDKLNLGPVTPNGNTALLSVKGNVSVNIESDAEETAIFISAPICRIPGDAERLTYFDVLMQAHGFGVATHEAYFCANPATGEIVLFKRLPVEGIDADKLAAALGTFLETLESWRTAIAEGRIGSKVESASRAQGKTVPVGSLA